MQFMNCLVSKGKAVPVHPIMKLGREVWLDSFGTQH